MIEENLKTCPSCNKLNSVWFRVLKGSHICLKCSMVFTKDFFKHKPSSTIKKKLKRACLKSSLDFNYIVKQWPELNKPDRIEIMKRLGIYQGSD